MKKYYIVHGYRIDNKHDAEKLEKQLNLLQSTINMSKQTEEIHDKIYSEIIHLKTTVNILSDEIHQLEQELIKCKSQ